MTDYQGRWANDELTVRIVQMGKDVSLYHRDPEKSDYINLCADNPNGNVVAQIHRYPIRESGRVLVLRATYQGLCVHKPLYFVENFEELSGDVYFNKQWLRATGVNYGHFEPAKALFVPNSILSESNDSEAWGALRELLEYAYKYVKEDGACKPAVIITHGDVDGMVCAAQLLRREKSNCDLLFSNARYVASKLKSVSKRSNLPRRIYVSDIPSNADAVAVVEQLVGDGVEVNWIDHHPCPKDVLMRLRKVCKHVVFNESLATPAGVLLGQWLADEDPYFDRIGRICYAFDKGSEWERNWFRILSSYLGKSDRDVLERLAFDRDFTEDDLVRVRSQEALEQLSADILSQKPETVRTSAGKTLAVYDTTGSPGVYLGHKVFENHPVDYCLIRIQKRKWQIASNPNSKLALRKLVGSHDLAGIKVRAAGRPDRLLAIEIDCNDVPRDIHEAITSWAKDLL